MKRRKLTVALLLLVVLLSACTRTEQPTQPTQPEPQADYSFTLTPEQMQSYSGARSYLVKREGQDLYRIQYTDCGVTYEDGKLSTKFSGMAVQVTAPDGEIFFPTLDLKGGETEDLAGLGWAILTDLNDQTSSWRFMLQLDPQREPNMVAMLPQEAEVDERLLSGDGTALPDRLAYKSIFFLNGIYYHSLYDDAGILRPIGEWEKTTKVGGYEVDLQDVLQLDLAPLVGGEYYIVYEITEKQGNTYTSGMIPYKTEPTPPKPAQEPEIFVKWEKGARQQLLVEENGVEIYLAVEKDALGKSYYTLKAKNDTDKAITFKMNGGIANGSVKCSVSSSLTVDPGKFVFDAWGSVILGIADGAPEMELLETLQVTVLAYETDTQEPVVEEKCVLVDMTQAWRIKKAYADYFTIETPAMDALAGEQILLENEYIRLTLVNAGGPESQTNNDLIMVFKVENLSHREQEIAINGIGLNDYFISDYTDIIVPAGSVGYMKANVSEDAMRNAFDTASIEKLELLIKTVGQEDWLVPSVNRQWKSVALTQKGEASEFSQGDIIWEQDGVQVGLRGYDYEMDVWRMTMTNHSGQDIELTAVDEETGDKAACYIKAGDGQSTCFTVSKPKDADVFSEEGLERSLVFQIYDFDSDTLIIEGTQKVILKAE